jgi:hypothetical protein
VTHDELVNEVVYGEQTRFALANALRAVVELHKPFMYDGRMGQYERCSFCTTEEEWLGEIYPCQTIQAIEKELG